MSRRQNNAALVPHDGEEDFRQHDPFGPSLFRPSGLMPSSFGQMQEPMQQIQQMQQMQHGFFGPMMRFGDFDLMGGGMMSEMMTGQTPNGSFQSSGSRCS